MNHIRSLWKSVQFSSKKKKKVTEKKNHVQTNSKTCLNFELYHPNTKFAREYYRYFLFV